MLLEGGHKLAAELSVVSCNHHAHGLNAFPVESVRKQLLQLPPDLHLDRILGHGPR